MSLQLHPVRPRKGTKVSPRQLSLGLERVANCYSSLARWMDDVSWYRDNVVPQLVSKWIPIGARRALELCCGTGRFGVSLCSMRNFDRYVGVDVSEEMVRIARRTLMTRPATTTVEVLHGDWLHPVHQERLFDVVVVKNALHLLDEISDRLRAAHRVTGAAGRLVVVETVSPSIEANAFVRRLFRALGLDDMKQHYFTRHSLDTILAESGWRIVGSETVDQYIDVPVWLERKASSLDHLEAAREVIRRASERVRRSMRMDGQSGGFPQQMLRLQRIVALEKNSPSDELQQALPA